MDKNVNLTLIEMPESYPKKKPSKVHRVLMTSNGVLKVTGADKHQTQETGKARIMFTQPSVCVYKFVRGICHGISMGGEIEILCSGSE